MSNLRSTFSLPTYKPSLAKSTFPNHRTTSTSCLPYAVLKHLMSLGIQPLHLHTMHELESSRSSLFQPGERVLFQGFEVYEGNTVDQETPSSGDETTKRESEEDARIFHPYSSLGTLTFASPDRFLAKTNGGPLPEGLCGGPVIRIPDSMTENNVNIASDKNNRRSVPLHIHGVVEGLVPTTHEDKRLAGSASFL